MGFSTKRGRPRKIISEIDLGTAQLRRHRAAQETSELLDVLLDKALLSANQHAAGLHLRWLFTTVYGAPNLSAMRLQDEFSANAKLHSHETRLQLQKKYQQAVDHLKQLRCMRAVADVAIYDLRKFPLPVAELELLRKGLAALHKNWWPQKRAEKMQNSSKNFANGVPH